MTGSTWCCGSARVQGSHYTGKKKIPLDTMDKKRERIKTQGHVDRFLERRTIGSPRPLISHQLNSDATQ